VQQHLVVGSGDDNVDPVHRESVAVEAAFHVEPSAEQADPADASGLGFGAGRVNDPDQRQR
jgi:hypothetical protein